MVEEFLLPNRAFAIEPSVDPPCGWTFDGFYNLGQGVGRALLPANRRVDQVHVVGITTAAGRSYLWPYSFTQPSRTTSRAVEEVASDDPL
jgi:hypothetical protein